MKRFLILILLLIAIPCTGQKLYFSEPYNEITAIDLPETTVLLHMENNYTDLAATAWTESGTAWNFTAEAARFNQYGIEDNTTIYADIGYITAGTTTAFIFDTDDFTIEFWHRVASITQSVSESFPTLLFNVSRDGSNYWACYVNATTIFGDGTNYSIRTVADLYVGGGLSATIFATSSVALTVGDWAHIVFERKAGVLKQFINGALVGEGSNGAATYDFGSANVQAIAIVRQTSGARNFIGVLNYDELRVLNGLAYYPDSFDPPTQPFGLPVFQKLITAPDGKLIFED